MMLYEHVVGSAPYTHCVPVSDAATFETAVHPQNEMFGSMYHAMFSTYPDS